MEYLTTEYINARIEQEICYETIERLSDERLISKFLETDSVKKQVKILENILSQHVDEKIKSCIINEYVPNLIPAGTKGVIRGNKFNTIIKERIIGFKLPAEIFDVVFEKKCEGYITDERPDWYILDKNTNKILIGMNQLDLWRGGHQTNRGSKYLVENKHNTRNSRLLCVICNHIVFKNSKSKTFALFDTGFKRNTLCYLNNLQKIICEYFNLELD